MKIKRRYRFSLLLLVLIIVNIVVYFFDYRILPDKRNSYQLDEASLRIVKELDEDIIITFYESDNLTPSLQHLATETMAILETYKKVANVPIHIDFVNPRESLEVELEATNAGINTIEKREENRLRKMFLGMIIQKGKRTEVLPMLLPQMSMEYLISSSLRRLMEVRRRKIGLIQGHGEPSLLQITNVQKRLAPNYELESVVLIKNEYWADYESLLILAPFLQYSDEELECLDNFLSEGKNIFIALDRVEYDTEENAGYKIDSRIEEWLVRKGLIVYSNFVVDNSSSEVRLQEFTPPISFPYFPKIVNFASHPSTEGVSNIVLRYASSMEFTNKEGVSFTPLAISSEVSGKKSLPLQIDLHHEWTRNDFLYPKQVVATIIEGKLVENTKKNAKIIVISDGDLMLDTNTTKRFDDNYLFVTNSIDWLSDTSGLATLKQKGVLANSKQMEIPISTLVKYINLFFPLFLIGLAALFFHYRRKRHIDKLRTMNL